MALTEDQPTEVERTTTTTRPVADPAVRDGTVSGSVLLARIIYFIGGVLVALLVIRFVLALLGAVRENPFANFIFDASYPFVWPFFGLFNFEPNYGQAVLELGTLVAIIVYSLVTVGLVRLLTLNRRDAAEI